MVETSIAEQTTVSTPRIAEQAVVSKEAHISNEVVIFPYAIIEGNVHIGPGTRIGPYCYIRDGTTIGANCSIEAAAQIGILPKGFNVAENTGVIIKDNTVIGEKSTIERASLPETYTTIGERTLVCPDVHIGHYSHVGNDVFLTNGVKLAGYVRIGNHANLGANVGVHQFVSIGDAAFVAANMGVSKDVLPYAWLARNERPSIYGLNAIALRRMRMTPEQVTNIKQAYTVLCETDTLDKRIHDLSALNTPEAIMIKDFLEHAERGTYLVHSARLINPAKCYGNVQKYHSNNHKL